MVDDASAVGVAVDDVNAVALDMVTYIGLGARRKYGLAFQHAGLQTQSHEWRMRILTTENIKGLATDGKVRFEPCREDFPNEQFILSMLRLTEHGDRLKFLNVVLDKGLLPPCYNEFRVALLDRTRGPKRTPVPGCISSGAFKNMLPLVKNFMERLLGLNVGRIMILVFDTNAAGRCLNLQEKLGEHTGRLKYILNNAKVDKRLIEHWCEQVVQCADDLTEEHHYETIDVRALIADGSAFLINFNDAPFKPYSVVAAHAAQRGEYIDHGGIDLYTSLAEIIEKKLHPANNPYLQNFPELTLANLRAVFRASAFFYIEDEACKRALALKSAEEQAIAEQIEDEASTRAKALKSAEEQAIAEQTATNISEQTARAVTPVLRMRRPHYGIIVLLLSWWQFRKRLMNFLRRMLS